MMVVPQISTLSVHHFRNLIQVDLTAAPINIISGDNGSGKSSLLEAMYYLAHSKSFRTSKPQRLIHHEEPCFSVFSTIETDTGTATLGVERTQSNQQKIKFNQAAETSSFVARHLPMQFIDSNCYQYFTEGPTLRRQFLNWGLFHMKHSFYSLWKNYNNVLKQRNAALRSKSQRAMIDSWDSQLIPLCEEIHSMRLEYVTRLSPIVKEILNSLLSTSYSQLELRYQPGWNADKPLSLTLQEKIYRDFELGYTQAGAHRADLQLFFMNKGAHEFLSQGQMKLAAYALKIAQCIIQKQDMGRSTIFLVDDLQAELDSKKQRKILTLFSELDNQCFYTALDQTSILGMLKGQNEIKTFPLVSGCIIE
jgi:DNA replication and repair protein RecF